MEQSGESAAPEERDWGAMYDHICELPPREREVLDLLVRGHDPKQIARMLGNWWSTIRNHIAKLRARFHCAINPRTCSTRDSRDE